MSERERWIVYPLLFLALGAALRDKLAKQTRAKQIVCEHLYLVDAEGRPAAVLTGEELRFDLAGAGNGYITANTINAQGLFQLGRPVITANPQQGPQQGLSLQQLLQMLRLTPGTPPPGTILQEPPKIAPPDGEIPPSEPPTPGSDPELPPPGEPAPEA